MKNTKLFTLLAATTLLCSCAAGWTEVSNEEFCKKIGAVENYQYATAVIKATSKTVTNVEGSGADLEAYKAVLETSGIKLGKTEEEVKLEATYTFNKDTGWTTQDEVAKEFTGIETNFYQRNDATIFANTPEGIKFYTGNGFKITEDMTTSLISVPATITAELVLDSRAYLTHANTKMSLSSEVDYNELAGLDIVLSSSMEYTSIMDITYSGVVA